MNIAKKFLINGGFIGVCIGGLLYGTYPGNFFFAVPLTIWIIILRTDYKKFVSSNVTDEKEKQK
jgi:hypothetical protein